MERNKLIETYGKAYTNIPKNLFKNIFKRKSGTGKKVENFLRETQPSEFMQEIPGYIDPKTGSRVI